jgi:hypothetical protein
MKKLSFVLFCSFVLLFQACQNYEDFRAIDSVNYEPEFAVPLINSSLSLDDVLENVDDISFLNIDPDGSMTVNYSQEPAQKSASELIQDIADFPIVFIDSSMSVPLQLFDNMTVTKLSLKEGTISFDIQSNHTEDIALKIIFPGITQNGIPFEMLTNLIYSGSTPVASSIAPISIEGYDLSIPNGNLEMRYEAYNTNGDRVLLDMISGEARDWEYNQIEGIWSYESFTVDKDTINIDIAENWIDGQISFSDPKILINLSNSIGIPMAIKIQNLTAHTADGNLIPLNYAFEDGYIINYPSLTEIGLDKADQIILDKNNSNIISAINALPQYITYEIVAIMNPESSTTVGFISENSTITGNLEIEIPIEGTASGFTLETSADFTMEEAGEIAYATFKLVTNNEIPVDLNMQLYFMDENNNIIDSLFEGPQNILAAPEIGANNTLLSSSEEINFIEISTERLNTIRQAKRIKTKAALSTANNGTVPVSIRSTQKVDVKMGAIIGIE